MNLQTLEQIAKILSLIAVPIILAVFGWIIQSRLTGRSVAQEYVKLAAEILKDEKADRTLRKWAVELLNKYSLVKFTLDVEKKLISGEVNLTAILPSIKGSSMDISPDGRIIATGHDDKLVRIWDSETGSLLKELTGHVSIVTSVAFSPSAKFLVSGSMDNTARIWDLETGTVIRILLGNAGGVIGVAVSPDGNLIYTRSSSGKILIWGFNTGALIRELSTINGT